MNELVTSEAVCASISWPLPVSNPSNVGLIIALHMVAAKLKREGLVVPATIIFGAAPTWGRGSGVFVLCFMGEETET